MGIIRGMGKEILKPRPKGPKNGMGPRGLKWPTGWKEDPHGGMIGGGMIGGEII